MSPVRRAVVFLAVAAIGIGAFQVFYLEIHFTDRARLREMYSALPYRRIPGLQELLVATAARTPMGSRVLIATPHRPWDGGYGYAYRRAQFVLAGREVIPLLDPKTEQPSPENVRRAEYIACWRECPQGRFEVLWRGRDAQLLRRTEP